MGIKGIIAFGAQFLLECHLLTWFLVLVCRKIDVN